MTRKRQGNIKTPYSLSDFCFRQVAPQLGTESQKFGYKRATRLERRMQSVDATAVVRSEGGGRMENPGQI